MRRQTRKKKVLRRGTARNNLTLEKLRDQWAKDLVSIATELSQHGLMESGEITLNGDARDLLNDPKVRAAYLGE